MFQKREWKEGNFLSESLWLFTVLRPISYVQQRVMMAITRSLVPFFSTIFFFQKPCPCYLFIFFLFSLSRVNRVSVSWIRPFQNEAVANSEYSRVFVGKATSAAATNTFPACHCAAQVFFYSRNVHQSSETKRKTMFQGRNASCNSLLRCFFFDNDGYNVMTLLTVPEKEPVITPPPPRLSLSLTYP